MEILQLPLIIRGKKIYPKDVDNIYSLKYNDIEVHFPKMTQELIQDALLVERNELLNLELNEILEFIRRVGLLWQKPGYELKQKLYELSPRVNGQSREMIKHNVALIISFLSFKTYLQQVIGFELPCREVLDTWVPVLDSEVHAVPLGKVLHIISGNVPVVGVYSVIRGLLTKNVNIAKIPSGDVLTILFVIQSFYDVDPNHPITKSTSAIYWERNEEDIIKTFVKDSDGLCIWGGRDSVNFYKSINHNCRVLEYGPKIGMQIIDWDENDDPDLAIKVAKDMTVYEQEACLSPQYICLKGDVDSFVEQLKKGLQLFQQQWPKPKRELDHYAHMNFVAQANLFVGNKVVHDENMNWLIIVASKKEEINLDHPLGRTIYIYPVDDIKDSLRYVVKDIQTIGIAPKKVAYELRDELAAMGIARISNIGNVDYPRLGTAHNGIYLSDLVRMVGMEREKKYVSRVYDVPDDFFSEFPGLYS